MAIYHCSMKVGGRSSGRSSVASAAYRIGDKLTDLKTGLVHDYSKKKDVIESFNIAPKDAPDFCHSVSDLWNEVEQIEKRHDAQLFRELTVALPRELSHEKNREMVSDFVQENFVKSGMVATVAFHKSKTENPHAHIMLTMRNLKEDGSGFGNKNREWNKRELIGEWRKNWADSVNKTLEKNSINERVDHRSLVDQGIERKPQIHLGVAASQMEKRGIKTERGDRNRAIIGSNNQPKKTEQIQPKTNLLGKLHLERLDRANERIRQVQEPSKRFRRNGEKGQLSRGNQDPQSSTTSRWKNNLLKHSNRREYGKGLRELSRGAVGLSGLPQRFIRNRETEKVERSVDPDLLLHPTEHHDLGSAQSQTDSILRRGEESQRRTEREQSVNVSVSEPQPQPTPDLLDELTDHHRELLNREITQEFLSKATPAELFEAFKSYRDASIDLTDVCNKYASKCASSAAIPLDHEKYEGYKQAMAVFDQNRDQLRAVREQRLAEQNVQKRGMRL